MDDGVGDLYKEFGKQEKKKNTDLGPPNGTISCIHLREKQLKKSMDAIMNEINLGIKDAPPDFEQEVFLGFESGAIGLFKL